MDLPFLHVYRSRGKTFAYYRRGRYRVRLRGELGSAPFLDAYRRAHDAFGATPATSRPGTLPGSLAALIMAYRGSPEWKRLRPASRTDYEKGLTFLFDRYGDGLVGEMNRQDVRAIQGAAAEISPSRANKAMSILSILLAFAIELGWRRDNPALRMPKEKTGGSGYRAWTPAEVTAFLAWADPFWRRALLIALCTGQRGQDVVAMTRASYDGTAIEVVQQKGGRRVWIPCHPTLRAELANTPPDALLLLPRPDGTAWPINAFQKAAGQAIRAAGLVGVVWHGLRATAASWLAESGRSDAEIRAITGHTTMQSVQRYTRGAEQKRLATAAIATFKLRHETE